MAQNARLKSLFILPALGLTAALLIFSLVQAVISGRQQTAWLGAALASVPLLWIVARLALKPPARTTDNLPLLLLIASAGVMVAGWEQFMEGSGGWGPTGVALAAGFLFLLYVFWYSRFGRIESLTLSVGNKLPSFELDDSNGQTFRVADLAGRPAVLLFYRGNWCPVCMAQIREIAERHAEFEKLGATVALISPQSGDETRALAEQLAVGYRFLVDNGNRVAESLGIAVKNGVPVGLPGDHGPDTVLPTVLVANANGTIIYSDQTDNYRVRPEPDIFLAIIRRAEAMAAA